MSYVFHNVIDWDTSAQNVFGAKMVLSCVWEDTSSVKGWLVWDLGETDL